MARALRGKPSSVIAANVSAGSNLAAVNRVKLLACIHFSSLLIRVCAYETEAEPRFASFAATLDQAFLDFNGGEVTCG